MTVKQYIWNPEISTWVEVKMKPANHTHVIGDVLGLQDILDGLAQDIYNSLDWDITAGQTYGPTSGLVTKLANQLGVVQATVIKQNITTDSFVEITDADDTPMNVISNFSLGVRVYGNYNSTTQLWLYREIRTQSGSGNVPYRKRYTHLTATEDQVLEKQLFPSWTGRSSSVAVDNNITTAIKVYDETNPEKSALHIQEMLSAEDIGILLEGYGRCSRSNGKKVLKLGVRLVDYDRATGGIVAGPMTYIDVWQASVYIKGNGHIPDGVYEKVFMKVH